MDKIDIKNPQRIIWCCDDLGITPELLAREAKISLDTLKNALDGQGGLTFGQLSRIGKYFGRGVLFFLEESPVEPTQIHSTQFRTLQNQKPHLSPEIRRLIERVERHRDTYVRF